MVVMQMRDEDDVRDAASDLRRVSRTVAAADRCAGSAADRPSTRVPSRSSTTVEWPSQVTSIEPPLASHLPGGKIMIPRLGYVRQTVRMPDFPEHRYAAASEFALPDLGAPDFVESVDTTTGLVEETRYDTVSRHLRRAGMDLCRRKDANAAAWHLTVSGAAEVMEIDSRATTPPREVSALLTAIRAGERLVVVEKIRREWDTHVLRDSSGEPVATLHDFQLTRSHPSGEFETEVWREVEVRHPAAAPKSDSEGPAQTPESQ